MGSNAKRQQTMAKRAREQALRDKRARKAEKKQAAAERKALGLPPLYAEDLDVEGEAPDELGEAETA